MNRLGGIGIGRLIKYMALCMLVSLVFQILLLAFIDNVYLPSRENTVEVVGYSHEDGHDMKGFEMEIPQTSGEVSVSYNGRYAGYIVNGILEIAHLEDNKRVQVNADEWGSSGLSYFKWLPDRNVLIYSLDRVEGNTTAIEISTYEPQSEIKRDYTPVISGLPHGSKVTGVELSAPAGTIYVEIDVGRDMKKVYSYDLYDKLEFVTSLNAGTKITALNYIDGIVYKSQENELTVRQRKNIGKFQIAAGDKTCLLGVNGDDMLFTGRLDAQGKLLEICRGKLSDGNYVLLKKMALGKTVNPWDVFITYNGGVYADLKETCELLDLNKGTRRKYEGRLLQVFNEGFSTVDDNILKVTLFE